MKHFFILILPIELKMADWLDFDLNASREDRIIIRCANIVKNCISSIGNNKGLTREHRFVSARSREDSCTDWCHRSSLVFLRMKGGEQSTMDKREKLVPLGRYIDKSVVVNQNFHSDARLCTVRICKIKYAEIETLFIS